jgi:hypothetical protein
MRLGKRERLAARANAQRKQDARVRSDAVPVTKGRARSAFNGQGGMDVRGKASVQWGNPDNRRASDVILYTR